jgi:hypothetical protein
MSGVEQEADAQKMAAALILGPDHKVINMGGSSIRAKTGQLRILRKRSGRRSSLIGAG